MSCTWPPQRATRATALIGALVVALVLAASCSDGGSIDGSPTSLQPTAATGRTTTATDNAGTTTTKANPTATSPTATVADPTHQAIIDAYVGYWNARFAANSGTPNPRDPALVQYATGDQLSAVIAETQKNLDQGHAFQASPNPANFRKVTVVSVDGDQAQVQECFVDDDQVVERSTGTVLDGDVATQSAIGTLRFVDGSWKVSGARLVQEWEGVSGCALAS